MLSHIYMHQRMQEETPYVCNQWGRSFSQKFSSLNHQESHVKIHPSPVIMVEEPSVGAPALAYTENFRVDINSVTFVTLKFSFIISFINCKGYKLISSLSKENCVYLDRKIPRPESGRTSPPTLEFCSPRIFSKKTDRYLVTKNVEDHCRHGKTHF